MLKNTENSFGSVTRVIHWVMSVLIITMLTVGFTMVNMEPSDLKWQIYAAHKACGLVVLFLAILRVLWIFTNPQVEVSFELPSWQRLSARFNHNLIYILLILMPASGALMTLTGGHDIDFFGVFTVKSFMENKEYSKIFWNVHVGCAFLLIASSIVHIAAALYHHFIRKDNVLMRMIRGF
jgi:cytochrome b561